MGKWIHSIKAIFLISVLSVVGIVFSIQFIASIVQFRHSLEANVNDTMKSKAGELENQIAGQLKQVGKYTELLAYTMESIPQQNPDIILSTIERFIPSNKLIVGAGFWFEPYAFRSDIKYYGPYKYLDDKGKIILTWDYSNEQYDYFKYDWYKNTLTADKNVVWSEPYLDTVTNIPMLTTSSPARKNGKVFAVTTVDIGINELTNYVRELKVGTTGYAFLLSGQGYYLGHKTKEKDLKDRISDESDSSLIALGKTVLAADGIHTTKAVVDGVPAFIAYGPIADTGMKVVLVYPEAEAYAGANKALLYNSLIGLVGFITIVSVILLLFSRRIAKPITTLIKSATNIAQGDLSTRIEVTTKDEIGTLAENLQAMTHSLGALVQKAARSAETVASATEELTAHADESAKAAGEVAAAMVRVSQGSTRQASVVDESMQAAMNMSQNVQHSISLSMAASEKAQFASQSAVNGSATVEQAVGQMQIIEQAVVKSSEIIVRLGSRSEEIKRIVDTISGISSQTSLLALNAAIEAARAGEQGRGFAVVADEVRKLADQSQTAAKTIEQLLNEVVIETESAVDTMRTGAEQVQQGGQAVRSVGAAFEFISATVAEVAGQIKDVSAAVNNMGVSTNDIIGFMKSIDEESDQLSLEASAVSAAAEQQAAAMDEVKNASLALAHMAEELDENIRQFRLS
ncbi:methyl-accepting chemotaxis protein [Sporomusa aerivorans]|uniref:methyl-accepting chemotaxis protein n=1 Tax=Sporomusa aerivorans TaxID=204936 RepID=UPI00352B7AE8